MLLMPSGGWLSDDPMPVPSQAEAGAPLPVSPPRAFRIPGFRRAGFGVGRREEALIRNRWRAAFRDTPPKEVLGKHPQGHPGIQSRRRSRWTHFLTQTISNVAAPPDWRTPHCSSVLKGTCGKSPRALSPARIGVRSKEKKEWPAAAGGAGPAAGVDPRHDQLGSGREQSAGPDL